MCSADRRRIWCACFVVLLVVIGPLDLLAQGGTGGATIPPPLTKSAKTPRATSTPEQTTLPQP
jgi:hypothetical protein